MGRRFFFAKTAPIPKKGSFHRASEAHPVKAPVITMENQKLHTFDPSNLPRISIITGHYGSGKTNIAVNMALDFAKSGRRVTIVDLDIVNPYFRTADFRDMLTERGIDVIAPVYANTNLDIPALPPEINTIFGQDDRLVIIDVGGDDAGAIALGQFASRIEAAGYDMYYVINERRYLTKDASEAAVLLPEIEASARIRATKLINNTNLGEDTTPEIIAHSRAFADEVSRLTNLPVAFTCAAKILLEDGRLTGGVADGPLAGCYPVELFVKKSWDN